MVFASRAGPVDWCSVALQSGCPHGARRVSIRLLRFDMNDVSISLRSVLLIAIAIRQHEALRWLARFF